jgi:hypothetical protein
LGYGVGLRRAHYKVILEEWPAVDWFEIISENFMAEGGRPREILEGVRAHYPVVMHGVALSLGSADPLNRVYLRDLAALALRIEPAWISDHLCWTGVNGKNLHDLLPLPYTSEAVIYCARRIRQVQDFLGRRILVENISSYLRYRCSRLGEAEFITAVAEEADCAILLDLNNVYVNSFNHRFDPVRYLDALPVKRIAQFHLAGFSDCGSHLMDTHDHPVSDPVWALYDHAVRRFGPLPTLVEWDDQIPPFAELASIAAIARARADAIMVRLTPDSDCREDLKLHNRARIQACR